jgi:UDP-GlcNAc:undecaprenyl-phosphate GlcNAc-1-phosphate transferase
MLIGLVIGGMAVQTSLKGPGTVLLATPLCLMVIPLFDSAAAMIRRKLTGRSIFSGDRAHLHHRLSERFGSTRAVAIVAVSCGVSAIAAWASIIWRNELVAVVSGAAIILMFVISKMFGHTEVSLLASRIHSAARSFFRLNGRHSGGDTHSTVHLQGNKEWELAWMRFRDAAMDLAVDKIELNVNAPMIQEGFHASWRRQAADLENGWRFEIPLLAAGRHRIGHIRVAGTRSLDVQAAGFEKIFALIEFFESEVETLFVQAGEGESVGRPNMADLRLVAQSREIGVT